MFRAQLTGSTGRQQDGAIVDAQLRLWRGGRLVAVSKDHDGERIFTRALHS
jgi:hypothetical protein